MIKVMFRTIAPERTKSRENDAKYVFKIVVHDYIKSTFRVITPKLERGVDEGYDDDKMSRYHQVTWFVDDDKPVVKEKIIWLDYVVDKVNSEKIINRMQKKKEIAKENQRRRSQ